MEEDDELGGACSVYGVGCCCFGVGHAQTLAFSAGQSVANLKMRAGLELAGQTGRAACAQ